MQIWLIRHAQPEWVRDELNVDNPPLTQLGFNQADLLGQRLRDEQFTEVCISPLQRTQQTAQPFLSASGANSVTHDWLAEIQSPIWHGTPADRAIEAYRAERQKSSIHRWSGLDGGESVSDFVNRINVGCSYFLESRGVVRAPGDLPVWNTNDNFNEDAKIALFAHAGTNSVTLCHLLGLAPTPWEWERFVIGHASVSIVQSFALGDGITFGVSRLSDQEHLPMEMRTH
jgi:probable phosphoglycerate mutase